MQTRHVTITDLITQKAKCPFPIEVIPNQMGINLCSVEGITWTELPYKNQIVSLTIHFKPVLPGSEDCASPENT